MPVDEFLSDESEDENEATGLDLDIPEAPDYTTRDAPTDLKRAFWTAAVLFNVALGAVSVGLMLIGFEGRWAFGGGLVVVGLVAFARGWQIYRARTARNE